MKAKLDENTFQKGPIDSIIRLRQVRFVCAERVLGLLISLDGMEALKCDHSIVRYDPSRDKRALRLRNESLQERSESIYQTLRYNLIDDITKRDWSIIPEIICIIGRSFRHIPSPNGRCKFKPLH